LPHLHKLYHKAAGIAGDPRRRAFVPELLPAEQMLGIGWIEYGFALEQPFGRRRIALTSLG
jgi:hypothetical protein